MITEQQSLPTIKKARVVKLLRRTLFLCIIVGFCGLAAGYVWVDVIRTAAGPHSTPLMFIIRPGVGTKVLKYELAGAGLVAHPIHYHLHAVLLGSTYVPKAGEYLIPAGASLSAITDQFHKGDVFQRRLVIPEGWRSHEIMEKINQAEGLKSVILRPPEEGSVLPNTYFYNFGMDRRELLKQMQAAMEITLAEIWAGRAEDLPYERAEQLLVMASMIEKETGLISEQARISSVFVNRLRANMRLQSDPTVAYGFAKEGIVPVTLMKKHLASTHRWNTYRHKGLPPTAIANPGKTALIAAAHPETSPYYYFVADGRGGHLFGKTLAEHNRNVRIYRNHLK